MMARSWSQIKTLVAQKLQDTGMAVYLTAELDQYLNEGLLEISKYRPRLSKETVTATASRDITLSAENKRNLISVDMVEYPISEYPQAFRNFQKRGDVLTLDLASEMTAGDSVYLYLNKKHILPINVLTDTAGAVKTTAALGATSLVLKSLGTESWIPEDTTFLIAGDTTSYKVTANAAIATNEATVYITPALAAEALADAVVTLTVPSSTLDTELYLEDALAEYVAAIAMINKAGSLYLEAQGAIAIISTITTSIGNTAARITQAVTDIGSGRTELAKTVAIIVSAGTAIGNESARITQAIADIGSGRTAAGKIDAIITAGAGKLADISAQITLAIADIADGRVEADKVAAIITSAAGEIALMNAEVDKAVSALTTGAGLLNTVPVGGGSAEYMNQAGADIQTARGYMTDAQGYFQQANSEDNLNAGYLGLASRAISAGIAKLQEASGFFAQARADEGANSAFLADAVRELQAGGEYLSQARTYISQAQADININSGYLKTAGGEFRVVGEYLNQAGGYMRQIASKLNIAQSGKVLEQAGYNRMALAEKKLKSLYQSKAQFEYSRS